MISTIAYRFLPIILWCCLAISACNDPTDIGQGILGEDEFFNTFYADSFGVVAHTIKSDSAFTAPTNALPLGYLLGNMNDPVLGRSTASFYAQLGFTDNSLNLFDSLALDSIVLSLVYSSPKIYGDTSSKHNVAVYEVEEPIGTGAYYSDQHFAYQPTPIGYRSQAMFERSKKVQVRRYVAAYTQIANGDTTHYPEKIDTATLAPQLRVRLNDELGWRILSRSNTQELKSTANFQQFFKGIYIKTDVTGNSMGFIDIGASSLILYYRQGAKKGNAFTLKLIGGVVNHFDHDYGNTPTASALAASYPNAQEYAYLQGINGTQFEFEVPSFKEMAGKLINRVELEMTALPDIDTTYLPPLTLTSYAVDSNDRKLFIYSYSSQNPGAPSYITDLKQDGTTADGAKIWKYTINYRDFAEELITGRFKKMGVRISNYLPYRAIMCGPEHTQYPMRWKVYYTEAF